MAKDVKIPVKVEGAEKAQRDLKGTGDAVKGVGVAGKQQAADSVQATAAAQQHTAAMAQESAQAETQAGALNEAAAAADGQASSEIRAAGAVQQATAATKQATAASKAHAGAHGRAAAATQKTAKATTQFDDSARTAVVGILGRFNPALASLANVAVDVAKGIRGISKALLGIIAIGVVVAGITKLFEKMRQAAREAREALKELRRIREEFAGKEVGPLEQITADLRRLGAFSRENLRRAYEDVFVRAMARGVPREEAAGLAGVGFAANLSAAQLALLAAAGVQPQTAEEARRTIAKIEAQPKVEADLWEQARAIRESRAGRQAIMQAIGLRIARERDPRFWEKIEGVSQDVVLLEFAKELGLLKPGAPLERIDELREEYWRLYRKRRPATKPAGEELTIGERARWKQLRLLYEARQYLFREGVYDLTGQEQDFGGSGAPEEAPIIRGRGFLPGTTRIIQNIGTAYLSPNTFEPTPDYMGEFLETGRY